MRRVLAPAAAALAVLALSAQPGANPAVNTPALRSPTAGAAEVRLSFHGACHFLRVVPAPDVDARFVWPVPDRALPAVMVPGPDGSRRVVPLAATHQPTPLAPNGDTCHPAPALAPLQRTTP